MTACEGGDIDDEVLFSGVGLVTVSVRILLLLLLIFLCIGHIRKCCFYLCSEQIVLAEGHTQC